MRGECAAFEADVTREASMKAMIDALQGQVGPRSTSCTTMSASRSRAATRSPTEITEEAFDRVMTMNLRGMVMAVKHVLPVMRAQKSGVILGISSLAAWENYPYVDLQGLEVRDGRLSASRSRSRTPTTASAAT